MGDARSRGRTFRDVVLGRGVAGVVQFHCPLVHERRVGRSWKFNSFFQHLQLQLQYNYSDAISGWNELWVTLAASEEPSVTLYWDGASLVSFSSIVLSSMKGGLVGAGTSAVPLTLWVAVMQSPECTEVLCAPLSIFPFMLPPPSFSSTIRKASSQLSLFRPTELPVSTYTEEEGRDDEISIPITTPATKTAIELTTEITIAIMLPAEIVHSKFNSSFPIQEVNARVSDEAASVEGPCFGLRQAFEDRSRGVLQTGSAGAAFQILPALSQQVDREIGGSRDRHFNSGIPSIVGCNVNCSAHSLPGRLPKKGVGSNGGVAAHSPVQRPLIFVIKAVVLSPHEAAIQENSATIERKALRQDSTSFGIT
ncbi:hypothetical protein SDJN02_16775, partial [Cucurbita argyrosperma subsp. argyrosperma]